jgi:response regulator of citrate/malate metabolism
MFLFSDNIFVQTKQNIKSCKIWRKVELKVDVILINGAHKISTIK